MGQRKKSVVWSYWIGILIVFLTHLYIIIVGLPAQQVVTHSILNLVAGCFLVYSWLGR